MRALFGFGCYRVKDTDPIHRQALIDALDAGVTVIDTSTNYGNGASERLVGLTLASHQPPSSITLVTKIGYAQGEALQLITNRALTDEPIPDVVEVSQGLSHCIHPEFLEEMLMLSQQRLLRERIDVLLLHNPEYYLQVAHQQGLEIAEARAEFYDRIRAAFAWLEDQRQHGVIGSYGVSSNTFGHAVDAPDFVSLEQLLEIATQEGGSQHGFSHAQMPLNLIEHHAVTTQNQLDRTMSVIEYAQQQGLTVMINRPLNAIVGSDLIRLASHDTPLHPVSAEAVEQRIHDLETAEHNVQQIVMENASLAERDHAVIQETFKIASALCTSWKSFEGLVHYRDVRRAYLDPRLATAERYALACDQPDLAMTYVERVTRLLDDLDSLYAAEENASLEELREAMADELGLPLDTPLQHVALQAVSCTAGVGVVLVGMRRPEYVADVLASAHLPETPYHRSTWNRIAAHLARLSA